VPPELLFSAREARALHLAAQGLLIPPERPAAKADVRRVLARMELLQLDTIHVVARSPYLVLFSRLGPYQPRWLDALLAEGALFEVWAHEACLAPIEDWPLHRRNLETSGHWAVRRARKLLGAHEPKMRALLAHVRAGGPVKASQFERDDGERGGWWAWKKEKEWLEAWLALGELMIARREGFHRVYDLTERVHPGGAALPVPSAEVVARALVERAVRALGLVEARFVHDYFRTKPRLADRDLAPLVEDGTLVRARVEGWRGAGYLHREHLSLARRIAAGGVAATHTALLSPFDPVVWDRERVLATFGFEYRLECYLPAPKRRFGYFSLPILRRGALVGRLDAKAHRQEGVFEVKVLHLEPGVRPSEALLTDLARALSACAEWHGTPVVRVERTAPAAVRRALAALLARPRAGQARLRAPVARTKRPAARRRARGEPR
jgi:uncharacterized protein YcaQ